MLESSNAAVSWAYSVVFCKFVSEKDVKIASNFDVKYCSWPFFKPLF
jgi:hypothetical protein